jgi:tripeptidyl-peptidase-1
LNQYYHPEDLVWFMEMFGAGFPHMDAVAQVVGPNPQGGKAGAEASLDVQYVMSTGANVSTVFWSTDSSHSNMDPFLEWVLAVANTSTPPNVISVSYVSLEEECSAKYLNRMNTEFAKLGLRGVSVLFASGDWGAGCLDNKYTPVFPATSPYITSVGATQLGQGNEEAVSFSSGGFSNFFPIPKYQSDVVETFLNSSTDLPNNKYFNTAGRGFPDIAALGVNYVIVLDGQLPGVSGTSASSPVVAGMFALINDIRLRIGKERLGFLNPLLYSKKSAFTDVTAGCGSGCSAGRGFCAMQGWDPITGLGTPLFNQWKQQFTG